MIAFGINLYLHSMILFCILTLLFFGYITGLTTKLFDKELEHLTKNAVKQYINEIKQSAIYKYISTYIPIAQMRQWYDKPYASVEKHNTELKYKVYLTIMTLLMVFAILIVSVKCSGRPVSIGHILTENGIAFLFIGIVELLFFTQIAFKYVPVKPSFLSEEFIRIIKQKIEK